MSVSPRLSTTCAVAGAVMLTSIGAIVPAQADGPLDAYLPKSGTISGHVVTFGIAPEDADISKKFRAAVQGHMDFFQKAVTSGKPGEPLPYNKRMDITEAQYDRLLHMKPEIKEGAAVTVAVVKQADGTVSFKPQDAANQLKDVSFLPAEKEAVTPYGKLTVFNEIHQKGAGPWGGWNGAEWAQVMPSDAEQPSVKIAFGKRDADGQGLMYYQVAPYKEHAEQSMVVFYKLD